MKYPDGQEVRLGDKVELWTGCCGAVVASLDAGEYSAEYSEADWAYLKSGVLVVSDAAGIIHYLNPEATFVLLKRDNCSSISAVVRKSWTAPRDVTGFSSTPAAARGPAALRFAVCSLHCGIHRTVTMHRPSTTFCKEATNTRTRELVSHML